MKVGVYLFATAVSALQSVKAESPLELDGIVYFATTHEAAAFSALPRLQAVEAAKELAARDFAADRFRILVSTKTIWSQSHKDYLKQH